MNYQERLQQDQKTLEKEELQYQVQEVKSEFEVSIAKTNRDLSNAKRKLEKVRNSYPLSPQDLVDAKNEVDSLQRGLDFLQEEFKMLFGE